MRKTSTSLTHACSQPAAQHLLIRNPVPSFLRKKFTRQRGFTLLELMTVVVIIAILAVIAVPSVAARLRERRSSQSAVEIANLYRDARMRAMGRGGAVLVEYNSVSGFTVREAIMDTRTPTLACQAQPWGSCLLTSWTTATQSRNIGLLNPSLSNVTVNSVTYAGTSQSGLSICFTPSGRSFVAIGTGTLSPLTSTVTVSVQRPPGIARTVTILPNGTSRLAL